MIRGPSILIVEEQQAERDAMARLLRTARFQVVTACDVDEALSDLREPVGFVIVNVRAGRTMGINLLYEWHQRWPDTPLVALTADGDVNSAVAAMKLGARGCLTKPVDPEELLDLVGVHRDCRVALRAGLLRATGVAQLLVEPPGGLFPHAVQPVVQYRDVFLFPADLVVLAQVSRHVGVR